MIAGTRTFHEAHARHYDGRCKECRRLASSRGALTRAATSSAPPRPFVLGEYVRHKDNGIGFIILSGDKIAVTFNNGTTEYVEAADLHHGHYTWTDED